LIDNLILEIQSNQKSNENGFVQLEKPVYEVPPGSQIIKVNAFAKFSNLPYYDMSQRLAFVTIQVTRPDGKIDSEDLRASHGVLNYTYMIKSNSPVGEYEISIKGTNYNDIFLEPVSFKLRAESTEEKAVPAWVKNNAGWWASDTISDAEFVAALQFLVKEGIITTQHESVSFGSAVEILYKTKMTSKKDPFSVILIQSTSNDACSLEEKRKAIEYGKLSEYLINKNTRPNPTQVTVYCMKIDQITEGEYQFVMKETRTDLPNMLIFVGNLEANREAFDEKEVVSWWTCNKDFGAAAYYKCKPNQIVVCDDCNRYGVHVEDFEDTVDKGMWRLSAAIGSSNFYETFGDRWDYEAYNWAYNSSVGDNQKAFDLCLEFDIVENELCSKLYEKVTFSGKPHYIMDIDYVKNNWRDDQKDVKKQIISLVGTGSEVEGFSKYTLFETGPFWGDEYESALASPTKEVDVTDVLTIEYPDDWDDGYYKYDWSIWDEQKSLWNYQEYRDLPKDDESIECCHVFQADNAIMRVGASLWKDDTRTEGAQVPWQYLGSMNVWFLDNVHYGGATDEERFDSLEDSERKYCSNASFKIDQYECRNFKVLEKSIYVTDEGRKAYSLLTSYDIKNLAFMAQANYVNQFVQSFIGTTTEVYIGEDAWQVWTEFDIDFYEHSRDVVDRFNSSLVLLDTTYPIPFEPVIPKKIVTEDGIQYKANRAWEDSPVWEDTSISDIEKETKISKYKVVCDTDCKVTLNEHAMVGEVVTKIWDGTNLELKQWKLAEKGGCADLSLCEWDKENEEWIIPKVDDKWIYETVDLKKFQDEKLHEQIWDIYKSITPKQIIEEIDTFLISTDDGYGGAAFIQRCIDNDEYGCGPPDVSNAKFVISFDPLDFAPTSGERQAKLQPGKIKDALEINMLKSVLIHENAHILSLSASQSDNDLIGWEELLIDDDWEKTDKGKTKQIFTQKEFVCAPNSYNYNSGCMKEDSYLNLFFQKFWADIYPEFHWWFEFNSGDIEEDGKNWSKSKYNFYQKYDDRFVSYYSANNDTEDFAEAFRAFVLWDEEMISNLKKHCSEKEGWNIVEIEGWDYWKWCNKTYPDNAIWEEKIRFFYDFPELVEMRDFIRSNL